MKKGIFILLLCFVLTSIINAQETYRIKKINKITLVNGVESSKSTLEFSYSSDKLSKIISSQVNGTSKELFFEYYDNKISITGNRGNIEREISFSNNKISNIFIPDYGYLELKYYKNKISSVNLRDAENEELLEYSFIYVNNVLNKLIYKFKDSPSVECRVYKSIDKLLGLEIGSQKYTLEWKDGRVYKLRYSKRKKLNEEYIFNYNSDGRMIRETKREYSRGMVIVTKSEIEYENSPGNDNLYLYSNNWPLNIFFNVQSVYKYKSQNY